MEQITLAIKPRAITGTRAISKLRRDGQIPGVVYGREFGQSLPVLIDARDLRTALAGQGINAILSLHIEGRKAAVPAMITERQIDPVTRRLLHVDLHAVNLREEIEARVPLVVVGAAPGVKEGGILDLVAREVTVKALPADIPQQIDVDVGALNIGDTLHVRDLVAPPKIKIVDGPEEIVVTLLPPAKIEEVAPAPAEEVPVEPELVGAEKPAEEEIPED